MLCGFFGLVVIWSFVFGLVCRFGWILVAVCNVFVCCVAVLVVVADWLFAITSRSLWFVLDCMFWWLVLCVVICAGCKLFYYVAGCYCFAGGFALDFGWLVRGHNWLVAPDDCLCCFRILVVVWGWELVWVLVIALFAGHCLLGFYSFVDCLIFVSWASGWVC